MLLSEDEPSGFQATQVVAPADTDISGLGIEVAVGVLEGLPFEGVLRFAFPWPGLTPCTWLTTLSRNDLIERQAQCPPPAQRDRRRTARQRTKHGVDPAAAARLSEIRISLLRTQTYAEGTDADADEGRSRPHNRRSAAPQQQDHDLRLEVLGTSSICFCLAVTLGVQREIMRRRHRTAGTYGRAPSQMDTAEQEACTRQAESWPADADRRNQPAICPRRPGQGSGVFRVTPFCVTCER